MHLLFHESRLIKHLLKRTIIRTIYSISLFNIKLELLKNLMMTIKSRNWTNKML